MSFFILSLFATSTGASLFGDNITIYDKNSGSPQGTETVVGRTGIGVGEEDQEVEPGSATGQQWDLEGFFLDGNELTMVGGYNFLREDQYRAGDLFLDVDGDVVYGESIGGGGSGLIDNDFGYDYVLDLDFSNPLDLTYSVFAIDDETTLRAVEYSSMDESNPFRYVSGGTVVDGFDGVGIDYYGYDDPDLEGSALGLFGGTHNAAGVNLSFLSPSTEFTAHFTMRCGNDNLMGYGTTPVPEPATMILFGTGLIGLAGIGRRNLRRSRNGEKQPA